MLVILTLSYQVSWIKHKLRILFISCTWLVTLHYYYLFFRNQGDINWIVGSYITVTAISLCLLSRAALLSYSIFVFLLSLVLVLLLPSLRTSVFLPGLITLLIQANIGLRSRMGIIHDLKESNERFQVLFQSIFEGILVHRDGKIVNTNEAFRRIFGFSKSELVGKNVLALIHPEEKDAITERWKAGEEDPVQARGITRLGRIIDIEVRSKRFIYDHQPATFLTVQDITMTLAENVRIRDEFISVVSHELKTPISALKLQTQMLEHEFHDTTDTKIKDAALLFNRQIRRLNELVDSMLDASRISSGRFKIEYTEFDLVSLVRDRVTLLSKKNLKSELNVQLDLPEQMIVSGDRMRLGQVVEILLTNAIKYGEGKPIHLKVLSTSPYIQLIVEDHGLGIAPESFSRIFNRFERAISSKNISGLGLGLYIARQIVEAHGGTISVSSKPGDRSTFTVRLPMEKQIKKPDALAKEQRA